MPKKFKLNIITTNGSNGDNYAQATYAINDGYFIVSLDNGTKIYYPTENIIRVIVTPL